MSERYTAGSERLETAVIPGYEGSVGPFPHQYDEPHVYARDVYSGAGNCVCARPPFSTLHVPVLFAPLGNYKVEMRTEPAEVATVFTNDEELDVAVFAESGTVSFNVIDMRYNEPTRVALTIAQASTLVEALQVVIEKAAPTIVDELECAPGDIIACKDVPFYVVLADGQLLQLVDRKIVSASTVIDRDRRGFSKYLPESQDAASS